VPDLRERWRSGFVEATAYDWAVEHEHVAAVLGRLIWGTYTSAFYRDIARLGELTTGARVLDIPCGGGVAFRGLRPEQELAYVAADASPVMPQRARAEADRRGIHWIESSRRTSRRCRSMSAASICASAIPAFTASPTRRRRSPRWRASLSPGASCEARR
jgi:SAM-dependent methyltransferase